MFELGVHCARAYFAEYVAILPATIEYSRVTLGGAAEHLHTRGIYLGDILTR